MTTNQFTGTATNPHRDRKFRQFNNDQYCIRRRAGPAIVVLPEGTFSSMTLHNTVLKFSDHKHNQCLYKNNTCTILSMSSVYIYNTRNLEHVNCRWLLECQIIQTINGQRHAKRDIRTFQIVQTQISPYTILKTSNRNPIGYIAINIYN